MTPWADQDLKLDGAIRDWVLLPIMLVMLLVGLLRFYALALLSSPPKPLPLIALREQRALLRSGVLRSNCNVLPGARFESRRRELTKALKEGRYLKDKPAKENGSKEVVEKEKQQPQQPPNPLDPANMEGMMDGLKKQVIMMVPQTVIMGWINQFFFGFLCIKLPFPLPNKFKQMLQRGIDAPDMDVSWVSSLSWYFLNLFGLNALYALILDDADVDAAGGMMAGAGGMMMAAPGAAVPGMPGQQQDFSKLFQNEADVNLQLVEHKWVCEGQEGVEDRVLRMHGVL